MKLSFELVFAALTLSASALPTEELSGIPLTKRTESISTDGVANLDFLTSHRLRAIAKVARNLAFYELNTGARHPSAHSSTLERRKTGKDPLTSDLGGSLWQGTIYVGTPAVKFTVDYDTGSSDLFLPGPKCTENCESHTIYKPHSSFTSKDLHKTYNLTYGDGSTVFGEQYTDIVTIAGMTAISQTLGASSQYSTGFAIANFPPDGLMGMAFKELSVYKANPVFQTLVAQWRTDAPVFAFKLAPTGSELFLGGVNKKLYKGAFHYAPVTEKAYWQIDMPAVSLGGKAVLSNLSAIIDTGTTLVVGDTANVKKLFSLVPGAKDATDTFAAGYYSIPCDSFPTISLTFGDKPWSISPATLNIGQISTGSTECIAGLVGADIPADFWIVGDVFLENVYTAFDVGSSRIGFAQLA